MIDLGSIDGLYRHQHELHVYCARCDRWAQLPLAQLVADGYGERRLPLRVRCRRCDAAGKLQVRPPMLARSSTGWISPPAQDPRATPS